jgi:hypothetical protein
VNAVAFWAANQAVPMEPVTTWGAHYKGTASDYERFREQIDASFHQHAKRRGLRIAAITVVKDGEGGFWVYGVAV